MLLKWKALRQKVEVRGKNDFRDWVVLMQGWILLFARVKLESVC